MRRLLKYCWMHFLFLTGALSWAKARLRLGGAVVVLTFHRVLGDEEYRRTSSPIGMAIRARTFWQLLRYLSRHCDVTTPDQLCQKSGGKHTRNRVVVTFDDGWKDNFRNAFPIARQYGIPLTIFVCPALQGRRFPFWPEAAVLWWRKVLAGRIAASLPARFQTAEEFVEYLKTLDPAMRTTVLEQAPRECLTGDDEPGAATMNWTEMRSLAGHGVVFGSHTHTHALLPQLRADQMEQELVLSRTAIERNLNVACRLVAYPNGDVTEDVLANVCGAGYSMGFTTRAGACWPGQDPLLIPRINVWEGKTGDWRGQFSRVAFEYSVFWKAARSHEKESGKEVFQKGSPIASLLTYLLAIFQG